MRKPLVLLMALLLIGSAAMGQTVQWRGVNTSTATSLEQINIDDPSLWYDAASDSYRLPTSADEALFNQNSETFRRDDLAISPTSAFEARRITLLATSYGHASRSPLYLQKSLTMESIYLAFGYASGGMGDNNLRIGSDATTAQLLLRQADQDAITGGSVSITGSIGTANIDLSGLTPYDPTDAITQTATRSARRTEIINLITAQSAATGVTASGTADITISATASGSSNFVYVVAGGTEFRTTGTLANQPLAYVAGLDFTESTLTLTGSVPVELATQHGARRTKWGTIRLYPGSKIVFNNPAITLIQQGQDAYTSAAGAMGGSGGSVEFTAVAGSVTLEDPGIRSDGNIRVGQHLLKARTDQTWSNPTGLGFIRMSHPGNGGHMLGVIDGTRLDNLGAIPVYFDFSVVDNVTSTISGGTFTSWKISGTASSGRNLTGKLVGDVTLTGACIIPGNDVDTGASLDPDYSLDVSMGGVLYATMIANGNSLNIAKGLKLRQSNSGGDQYSVNYGCKLDMRVASDNIQPVTLDIGGIVSIEANGTIRMPGGTYPVRKTGIVGDALTTVNVAGNYYNIVRSMTEDNFLQAQFNLVGGTDTVPQTLEVMAAPTESFASSTSAYGLLGVGNGTTPAFVQLVNANRNDSDDDWATNESLMAGNIVVRAGSKLDCNLGVIGGISMPQAAPAKISITGANATGWPTRTGIMTFVTKSGSFTVDLDTLDPRNGHGLADAINAAGASFGVTASCAVWYGQIDVQTNTAEADDFILARGGTNIGYINSYSSRARGNIQIAADGTLDLNTGILLTAGDKVSNFVGTGDQTAAWNAVKSRVVDSSNPDVDFEAVAVDIQDYELDPEADPIYITVWAVAAGSQLDPIDASVAIAPDFVYQNNLTTGGRHKAVMTVTVNNVVGTETYTVTVDGIADSMISVAAGTTDLTKNLVGGTRNVAPTGLCSFNVTVTDSLGRSTAAAIPASVMVRKLGDIDGNGFVEPTDKGLLNSKLNGVSVPGVAFEAFDLDGNGFAEPTDKGLLNNILNGVTVN